TLPALKAELRNRRAGIVEKPALVIGIGPSLGHDGGTVVWTHLGFVSLDQHIKRLGIDVALRHQDGFESSYAQFQIAEMRAVVMIVLIVHLTHPFATSADPHAATSSSDWPMTIKRSAQRHPYRAGDRGRTPPAQCVRVRAIVPAIFSR